MINIKKSLNLGSKIKTARKQAGFSQKELAQALNLSDKAVSSWEVGRAQPPVSTLREISRVTNYPIIKLADDEDDAGMGIEHQLVQIERELRAATEGFAEIKKLLEKKKTP